MPSPNPIYTQKPFSLAHLRSVFANSDPVKLAAMTALMPWDYFHKQYEFQEATLNADWTAVRDSGNTATNFAYNAQRNGALQGATGATDDGSFALHYHAALFNPSDNPFVWFRWVAPAAVTGFSFEIGFSDPKTDEALPGITDVDADPPTVGNGVTDIAAVHMDTDQAVATARIVGDGTTGAAVGRTLTNDAGTAWTPTAGGIIDTIVGVRANRAFCWIWDSAARVGVMQAAEASGTHNGPDANVLIRPYAMFRTRNTTSKTISLLKAVIVAEENRTS